MVRMSTPPLRSALIPVLLLLAACGGDSSQPAAPSGAGSGEASTANGGSTTSGSGTKAPQGGSDTLALETLKDAPAEGSRKAASGAAGASGARAADKASPLGDAPAAVSAPSGSDSHTTSATSTATKVPGGRQPGESSPGAGAVNTADPRFSEFRRLCTAEAEAQMKAALYRKQMSRPATEAEAARYRELTAAVEPYSERVAAFLMDKQWSESDRRVMEAVMAEVQAEMMKRLQQG